MSCFKNSINQWCLGRDVSDRLPHTVTLGRYNLYYSDNTEIQHSKQNETDVCIIGLCVDATGAWERHELAKQLASLSFDDFLRVSDNLCGTFSIIRIDAGNRIVVLGDATHMMPIYYGVSEKYRGVVATCEALIVDKNEPLSKISQHVLSCANDKGHYLVADMTMYDGVKCLLPNHYLDVVGCRAIRYFPVEKLVKAKTRGEIDEIVLRTFEMIKRVVRQYSECVRFAAPLTPGDDSRLVCAFLLKEDKADAIYYVIDNQELKDIPQNVPFLNNLSQKMGIKDFRILPVERFIPENVLQNVMEECGDIRSWDNAIWAYHPIVRGRAVVRGDVVDHIAKSGHFRGSHLYALQELLPRFGFLKALHRNTSRYGAPEFDRWYQEMKRNANGHSFFDLFYWETRLGRWNSNTASINAIFGIQDLNFFNCGKILKEWCRIPRSVRGQRLVHQKYLDWLLPGINNIPVNPYRDRHHQYMPHWVSRWAPRWALWVGKYWISWFKYH